MSDWRTAAAWAAEAKTMRISRDVMPHTKMGVIDKAGREGWPSRERKASGGGREYPVSALPEVFRKALSRRELAVVTPPAVPATGKTRIAAAAALKDWQRKGEDARLILLSAVDQMVATKGMSVRKAIETLVEEAQSPDCSEGLQRVVAAANARRGEAGERTLSVRTLYRWLRQREEGALAPKAQEEKPIPGWAATFLKLYGRPTKPDVTEVLDAWPEGEEKPSYSQARHFLARLDAVSRNWGRMGPRALKSMQAYTARDVSGLWPGAVFIGDGHTYKAEVAHPIHGRPFRPEVTSFLDVFTRRWVGWSAALAESTWAVADALRHAITTTTTCDIVYYDNGSGAKNKAWDDDVTGMIARLGMFKLHSAPWSSQARGVIEVFHRWVLHKEARKSATYVGPRMDKEAKQLAYKITRKQIAEAGASAVLQSWAEFCAQIDAAQATYNDRPHSALDKIIDPETGKRRHMTPNEAWAKAVAEGWTPDPLPADEATVLFRPAVRRKVSRGIVEWIGNQYFAPALEQLHGDEVMVSYDLHDAGKVWVSLLDGRFVCEAVWNAHRTSYVPVSFAQHTHEKRVAGKIGRLNQHIAVAEAERTPLVIEHQPVEVLPPDMVEMAEAQFARLERPAEPVPAGPADDGRPKFFDDVSWAMWVVEHPDQALPEDRRQLGHKLRNRNFRLLLEMQGLDVGALSALAA